MTSDDSADGRRVRGDATRRKVARRAADIATTHGLDSITVGSLAAQTDVSKSGILTVFDNREAIQLAAVTEAARVYRETVIAPALGVEPGKNRMRTLIDAWIAYLEADTFPGGCFVAATTVEYGHRVGPVADAVRCLKREWLDFLAVELATANSDDPLGDAFRIDAFLNAGNNNRELFGDDTELERARDLALQVIGTADSTAFPA